MTSDSPLTWQLDRSKIKKWLVLSTTVILICGSIANYFAFLVVEEESNIQKLLFRFDLGHEPSIPNLYSTLLILSASIATFCVATQASRSNRKLGWYFLAFVLFGLAIDETVMFHETLNAVLSRLKTPAFIFPWTIAGLLFALSVLFVVKGVFQSVPRSIGIRFLVAGMIFVAGALGVENGAAYVFHLAGSEEQGIRTIAHWLLQSIEESMEMFGMLLFLFAVIDHLVGDQPNVELTLGNHRNVNGVIKTP